MTESIETKSIVETLQPKMRACLFLNSETIVALRACAVDWMNNATDEQLSGKIMTAVADLEKGLKAATLQFRS